MFRDFVLIVEKEMIKEVIKYLQYVVSYVNPSESVFIAIDGVAPRAKMNQQRSRRFKSAKDKKIINDIKKKHRESIDFDWDTNAITPGTSFMNKLCHSISDEIQTNEFYSNLKITFSDANVPMEGEHKILEDIRRNPSNTCCIYGLDADLIFLSLLSNKNIYLLREKDQFADVRGQKPFVYMDIITLKEKLISELDCHMNIQKDMIKDFIVLCFFLGNDFIPKLPCLFIHNEGIEIIIETYKTITREHSMCLTDEKNNINKDFLYKFIDLLSETEGRRLQIFHKERKLHMTHNPGSTPCEIELKNYDNLWPPIDDIVELGKKGWKDRYYNHFFNLDRFKESNSVKEIVGNYITTLNWVWEYYTTGIPSWTWFYKYHHAPVLSDINFAYKTGDVRIKNII